MANLEVHMPALHYLFRDSSEKSICFFSHLEAFSKKKFVRGPPRSYVLLARKLPALAWVKHTLLAYQGKEQEPRKAWATKNILESISGSCGKLMHHCWISISMCLPSVPQTPVSSSPPSPTWHWASSQIRAQPLCASSCKQVAREYAALTSMSQDWDC